MSDIYSKCCGKSSITDVDELEEVSGSDLSGTSEDEDADADAPRTVLWQEDDDEGVQPAALKRKRSTDVESLQHGLSSLPLGALMKARRQIAQVEPESGQSSSESEPEYAESEIEDAESEIEDAGHDREEGSSKPSTLKKRQNKHAPMEMSSKRPASRKRAVLDDNKVKPRDPRFLSTSGNLSDKEFHNHYGFLSDVRKDELQSLKDDRKRARKLVANAPRDVRHEREAELEKLEYTIKRMESLVNRDKREKVEQTALEHVRREEKEKQKHGKGKWFMKNADKREVLLRARYDALRAEGGALAVKKAIEKKSKKANQKEKKSRPFMQRSEGEHARTERRMDGGHGRKRSGESGAPRKRRKVAV